MIGRRWAKPGKWVYIAPNNRLGCIHSRDEYRLIVVVPSTDEWPFPSWVHCDIDCLAPAKDPNKEKKVDSVVEFEEALL